MRSNVYKNKVLAVLKRGHLLSISDIHKAVGGADFSTVFRNVERLVNEGLLKRVVVNKDIVLFETAEQHVHDHFVCNYCGLVEAIPLSKRIHLQGKRIADVLVRGTCGKCEQ